eukprot:Opistho-2@14853
MEFNRFIEYIAIIGIDDADSDHNDRRPSDPIGRFAPKILHRFPTTDHDDSPFVPEISMFCHPTGWTIPKKWTQPTFFVAVMTELSGARFYIACFNFVERRPTSSSAPPDAGLTPRSICIVSRHPFIDAFSTILRFVYTNYCCASSRDAGDGKQKQPLEVVLARIATQIPVAPRGGTRLKIRLANIADGDEIVVHRPPRYLPMHSSTPLSLLFRLLDVENVLTLFGGILTEQRILFQSSSVGLPSSVSQALMSLMHPFVFSHSFIPVLPESAIEVISAPTPFVIGMHASMAPDKPAMSDVIEVDLDTNRLTIPDDMILPRLPAREARDLANGLRRVLHPDVISSDLAWGRPLRKAFSGDAADSMLLDYEIKCVFLRFMASLLHRYRDFVTVTACTQRCTQFSTRRHFSRQCIPRRCLMCPSQALLDGQTNPTATNLWRV